MSATNRGSERHPSDFYVTPEQPIRKFLENYKLKSGAILDPAAGDGMFSRVIKDCGYKNTIDSVEIRAEEHENLFMSSDAVYMEDFLSWKPDKEYRTIITNPPFSLAKEFIQKCFEIKQKDTDIIMLLRLSFLESKDRYEFWQEHSVNKVYVLSRRPSFTGHGTDACAYAFFVFDNSGTQKIKVI
jgi:predicted RNA methylase